MDLDSLKYADLRQLAKSVGLKANMKADKLLKALKEHFEQKESSPDGNDVTDVQASDAMVDPTCQKVTVRRRKTMNAKRKHSEEPSVISEAKPVLVNAVSAEPENERRSSKRRKVSSSKDTETPVSNDVGKKYGKIPRHAGLMKRAALKPTTPNFKKLHQAQFDKMESIDSYLHRKNKPIKIQVASSTEKLPKVKAGGKPPISRASLFSPGLLERTAEKRRVTSTSKSALKTSRVFKPTVLTSNKINVRFSQATQDNEHKRSLMKTPSRMSPMVALTPTPGRKSEGNTRNSTLINKTPVMTTFVFGGSTTPATNKKSAFDLKASLSRPLTYKPHKGKLKPYGETQENMAPNKMQTAPSHQKNIKQHQVQTREDRRAKHTKDRKQKKEKMLDTRRGLVMT